ncbi:MAG TPA: fimbria/pilus periplasmic chaperone [Alphaproteobacteria bacterium]|nr:fimbria/pilus periplasmic chaperone [Alphaproteobacteria bacterium]
MLAPTRIVLEGAERYATVTVKNSGDGTGRYRIDLVDTTMKEDGSIQIKEEGQKDTFSALDILSISPRSMTLKPDEFQTVRILVRNPEGLQDGEYRSHLKVKMVENDIDDKTGEPAKESATIALKPKLVMVVPVIVRHGQTSSHVSISGAGILPGAGPPQLKLTFAMDGNRSVIGDIKVVHVGAGGEETVKSFPGVAIYRGVAKRDLVMPLDVPAGKSISGGKLVITYSAQEKDGGQVMAQKEITM